MSWLNGNRMRLVVVEVVAAIVLGGGQTRADVIWKRKADMPTTRYEHSTSVVNGKIYAFGGDGALTRVDEYDPVTDTWTRKADMPTARYACPTCVVNEKIYVVGGGGGPSKDAIAAVEVYDPATDTWAEQTEVPTPRGNPVLGVVDGVIYVIGSKNGPGSEWGDRGNIVEAYDLSTDTWARKADMPTSRWNHTGCVVNGKIYVIGGNTNSGALSTVEQYDPVTDTWTRKTPMRTTRTLLTSGVVGGKIYAIGGWQGNVDLSSVEVYDPTTDTWTKAIDIPSPTEGLSASVVDGVIYVMGGWSIPAGGEDGADTSAVYASEPIVDFNGDGIVDAADMCIMVDHWGTDYSLCDIGPTPFGDGIVDVEDLKVFADHLFEEVDDPTLIAHWPFDEAQGDIAYNSSGENDGTLIGSPAWQPEGGMVAGALQLDGVDDYVVIDETPKPDMGAYSVLAWIQGGAPGQVVLSQMGKANWLSTDPSRGTLMTELTSGGLNSCSLGSEAVITDRNWHRIAFVWDGSYRRLYVDGVVVAEDAQDNLDISVNGLYFGTGKDMEPGTFFSGLIDDIRIYNRVVTP